MVNFRFRKIFRGNLNEAILLVETDVTFQTTSISANEIGLFPFPWKLSLERKLANEKKNQLIKSN